MRQRRLIVLSTLAIAAVPGVLLVPSAGASPAAAATLVRSPELTTTTRLADRRSFVIGDRFYAVDAGSFEIVRDGTAIATAAEGDYFGEIALLHDVPRTATVRATSDAAVWALDQEEFLATVTGLPQAASAAHAISQERRRTTPTN